MKGDFSRRAEERALRGLVGKRGVQAVRAVAKAASVTIIDAERRRRAFASGPTDEDKAIQCASCGFLPRWDDKLKVWRPHGR